jgi:putative ABC transport system permease protein
MQVALALVLLVGSGLMLRSFQALRQVDPGFDPTGVLTAGFNIPPGEVPNAM